MSAGPRTELLGIPLEKALGWYRPICCDSSTSPCLGVMAVLGAFTWDTGPAHRFQPWPWLVTWPWESAVVSYWDVLLSSSSLFLTILSVRISWETVKLLSKVMALSQSIHLIFWFSGSNIMTTLCHGHWPLGSPFLCAGQPFVWFSAPEFCPWSTWGSTAFSLSNSHFFFLNTGFWPPQFSLIPHSTLRRQKCSALPTRACWFCRPGSVFFHIRKEQGGRATSPPGMDRGPEFIHSCGSIERKWGKCLVWRKRGFVRVTHGICPSHELKKQLPWPCQRDLWLCIILSSPELHQENKHQQYHLQVKWWHILSPFFLSTSKSDKTILRREQ